MYLFHITIRNCRINLHGVTGHGCCANCTESWPVWPQTLFSMLWLIRLSPNLITWMINSVESISSETYNFWKKIHMFRFLLAGARHSFLSRAVLRQSSSVCPRGEMSDFTTSIHRSLVRPCCEPSGSLKYQERTTPHGTRTTYLFSTVYFTSID